MKRRFFLFAIILLSAFQGKAQTSAPLTLIQTIEMPNVPVWPTTDHLGVDVKRHRLFTTPEASHSVQVLDLDAGKFLHEITGLGLPRTVIYRSDLDQIYVTDAEAGLVRIYDGRDYRPLQTFKLLPGTDEMGYDPATQYLFVRNGGKEAKVDYSLLSIIDTKTGEHVDDFKFSTRSLGQMAFERSSPRLYLNVGTDKVAVLDRKKRTQLQTWPTVTKCNTLIAMALDEGHHRLFVGCRNSDMHGAIVVFDTQTGKEIEALPIGGLTEDLAFDPRSGRIYASCGTGYIYVYQERDPDHYDLEGKVESGLLGKTGLLVPELNRYFVSVPHIGTKMEAKILVFQLQWEVVSGT